MTQTSRAVVLTEFGKAPEVRTFTLPEPEEHALIVAIEAATVCGTDQRIQSGHYGDAAQLPLVLGHEMVGRVTEACRRQTDATGAPLRPGDLVAWAYAWCGECYYCAVVRQKTLCVRPRKYGWGPASQFPYLMPQCEVVKVPDGLDPALAASATCALRTVVHAFEKSGGVNPGDVVLIQGAGPVGLYASAWAIRAGAARVICIGAPAGRLDAARQLGATNVIDLNATTPEQRREQVLELSDGHGADLAVECSGVSAAVEEGITLLRPGGRYSLIGQSGSSDPVTLPGGAFTKFTFSGVSSADISHYYRALRFLRDHQDANFADVLLGRSYSLDEVPAALESVRNLTEIKPVVLPAA
jgi:threonine dehydrogenase-like Zn-dependent dehydrogenase